MLTEFLSYELLQDLVAHFEAKGKSPGILVVEIGTFRRLSDVPSCGGIDASFFKGGCIYLYIRKDVLYI